MKRKIIYSLVGFVVVVLSHALYTIAVSKSIAERWATVREVNVLSLYIERGEYLIGASYGLALGFSIYALLRFVESNKKGVAGLARQTSVGLVGGVTITGILYVAGCFLLGCCGSPMLAVYLTLFGSSFLGFTKVLTFGFTLASVVVRYIWMERSSTSKADCLPDGQAGCEGDTKCK